VHFGRRRQVRLLEPVGKVPETLQEIGASAGEHNFGVYKVQGRIVGKEQKIGHKTSKGARFFETSHGLSKSKHVTSKANFKRLQGNWMQHDAKRLPYSKGSSAGLSSLAKIDLFKDLPASQLQALEKTSKARDFKAGHVFFQPGETGNVLFILEKGSVQTFRPSGRKKLIIVELDSHGVFGEMGCIGEGLYYCVAQTTGASRIRTISRSDLDVLLEKFPSVARRFLDLVKQRFFHILTDLEATSSRSLIPRIAKLLLEKAEGDCIRNMTHRQIAEQLRVYRESVTEALGELRKAGIIAIERKQIQIIHRARLERATRE
jgi:CRP/FNR family transcriptional regulator, cyclic AMP receptor protein